MKYSDIIVPRGRSELKDAQNQIAIDFIVHNLEHHLILAGYDIEVTKRNNPEIVEVFNENEYEKMQSLVRETPKFDLDILSSEGNEKEWESVFSSMSTSSGSPVLGTPPL